VQEFVSLVIPGKNCVRTIRQCLDAVVPMLSRLECRLTEIIFVDDGSTDDTARIVAGYPIVRFLQGPAGGPGAARNVGWRAAKGELVWFIDSDCIAEPDALVILLKHFDSPRVAAVGGSYANACPKSLLANLIHEEIAARHAVMRREVNFLAGFNVVYRRSMLEQIGGFDEILFNGPGSPGAEDAELSFKVHAAGYVMRFDSSSRVAHYHPTRLFRYLRAQRHHGYWRVNLHLCYSERSKGDAYSSFVDHAQPPLALLAMCAAPLAVFPAGRWLLAGSLILLAAAQIPLMKRLFARTKQPRMFWFAPLGFLRAFARALGMLYGMWHYAIGHTRLRQP
jgi:glycosyltransferase involved in cell wall biosynthesis